MAKMATAPSAALEPIDRLEDKIQRLVGMVERMKSEQVRLGEENQRLVKELESTRARVAAGETVAVELTQLKEERDVIRTRVTDMLQQLEALNL